MTLTFAPNIDLLFAEAGPAHERIRAAHGAGFAAVEMWMHSDKDLDAIERVLDQTGVRILSHLAEPRPQWVGDGNADAFLAGLEDCLAVSRRLGIPNLVVGGGAGLPRLRRADSLPLVVEGFQRVAERIEGEDVTVVIEAVNTRVDHPGSLLARTVDSATVARRVGSPQIGILYDMYHSISEEEDVPAMLAEFGDVIRYVQIADSPGRGEPGSGDEDWAERLGQLSDAGYSGPVGLEFYPTRATVDALGHLRSLTIA